MKILDFLARILSPQDNVCLLCARALSGEARLLCPRCAGKLDALRIPRGDQTAADRISAFYHAEEAQRLVHLLKYEGTPIAAEPLGAAMARAAEENGLLEGGPVLVPVPVSAKRLKERGYNQAALLARAVARETGLRLEENLLRREEEISSQVGRGRGERLAALKNAFHAESAAGLNVVIIDDVATTGATGEACARALLAAGALSARVLTANRVSTH